MQEVLEENKLILLLAISDTQKTTLKLKVSEFSASVDHYRVDAYCKYYLGAIHFPGFITL